MLVKLFCESYPGIKFSLKSNSKPFGAQFLDIVIQGIHIQLDWEVLCDYISADNYYNLKLSVSIRSKALEINE